MDPEIDHILELLTKRATKNYGDESKCEQAVNHFIKEMQPYQQDMISLPIQPLQELFKNLIKAGHDIDSARSYITYIAMHFVLGNICDIDGDHINMCLHCGREEFESQLTFAQNGDSKCFKCIYRELQGETLELVKWEGRNK